MADLMEVKNDALCIAEEVSFKLSDIDTKLEDGTVWFCLSHVGRLLELSDSTVRMMKQNNWFDPDEMRSSKILTPSGTQNATFISESALYRILNRSNSPKARPFERWVTKEVLPTIRKTGSYSLTDHVKDSTIKDRLEAAKVLLDIVGIKDNQLALALDKVYKHDTGFSLLEVADVKLIAPTNEQLLTPTQIGRMLEPEASSRYVNDLLTNYGYQRKTPSGYEPTDKGRTYATLLDVGKRYHNGTPIRQLKWNSSIVNIINQIIG